MEFHQLTAFQAVARTGNLTRASEGLHLSQSALSTQIRNLEEELGVGLFTRQAKGMRLTRAGEALLPHAEEVLDKAREMGRAAIGLRAEVCGNLNIGLNTDPTFLRLNRVIRTVTSAMPQVTLTFCISQTLTTEAMLKRGEMDMGFAFGSRLGPDIGMRQLATTPVSIVVPKHMADDPATLDWKRIAAMPWVWTTCQCPFHLLCQERMNEAGVRPNTVTEAVDENIVKELALGGIGVTLLRRNDAEDVARQGAGVIWEPGEIQVPLSLAWLARRDDDRLITNAVRLIGAIWQEEA
ncbi:MAG: LysR family transcriptional regulator [Deltaproteobacteria bacterium HGW-Deltaproteobacteria-18]|nr:MAG: LysR family transcriptional regulator [Deltaproteobacteria bacterium HGW-Deltaproteobacteria-18]